ncbi:ribonuclease H [Verticillium dahliae]|nr:ribonuclease H [Verticillium dahliae]
MARRRKEADENRYENADKSFLSRDDALAFVAGKNPAPPASGPPQPAKFYAVARGEQPGIYTDWPTAQKAIGLNAKGKGPKYKKFETRAEAVEFIEEFGDAATVAKVTGGHGGSAALTKKTTATARGAQQAVGQGMLAIYTDGSSLANGKVGAAAGVGVFFGVDDARNLSERLEGEPQTNQRAELTAIIRALEIAPDEQDVQIFTDSQYSINCVTSWYKGWQKKDWHNSKGEPVKNRDLVEEVRELIETREAEGASTVFTWVKGHADNVGNTAADHLAVAGARMPPR